MRKNKSTALILCILFGYLGVHRFYVGKTKSGILYLCTAGLCGIGWIVDIVLICTDKFTDCGGQIVSSPVTSAPVPTKPNNSAEIYHHESEGRKHFRNGDFGHYRNSRLRVAQCLQSGGDYSAALSVWSEVLFWDLTGLENGFKYESFLEVTFPSLFPYDQSLIVIAPAVIREIGVCQRKLGLSDEQLMAAIYNGIKSITAPVQLFTYKEISEMYFWERDGNKSLMRKAFSEAKARFNPKKPQAVAKM